MKYSFLLLKELCEKYELTEQEINFLDRLCTRLGDNMNSFIKGELSGDKSSLRHNFEGILEDMLTSLSTQKGLERIATTEQVKKYSTYMADKLYLRVNS